MAALGTSPLLLAIPLLMCFGQAAAGLTDSEVCFVLDGILFLYGIILTALYCKIKIQNDRAAKPAKGPQKNVEDGIYTDLTPRAQDTYETIQMKK